MHIGADLPVGDRWLGKVHLPTGAVGLERVVALTIAELGVELARDDWERLIGEAAGPADGHPPQSPLGRQRPRRAAGRSKVLVTAARNRASR